MNLFIDLNASTILTFNRIPASASACTPRDHPALAAKFAQEALHGTGGLRGQHLTQLQQGCSDVCIASQVLQQQRLVGLVVEPFTARIHALLTNCRGHRPGQVVAHSAAAALHLNRAGFDATNRTILYLRVSRQASESLFQ